MCLWVKRTTKCSIQAERKLFSCFTPQAYCTFDLKAQKNTRLPLVTALAKQIFPFATTVCVCARVFTSSWQHAARRGRAGWVKNKQESYLCSAPMFRLKTSPQSFKMNTSVQITHDDQNEKSTVNTMTAAKYSNSFILKMIYLSDIFSLCSLIKQTSPNM